MEPLFSTEWERIEYEREQAAKRRERELRAELDELRAALAPFARYARHMRGRWGPRDDSAYYGVKHPAAENVRYGDFRRAERVYFAGGNDGALAARVQKEGGEDDDTRGGGGAAAERGGAVGGGAAGGAGV